MKQILLKTWLAMVCLLIGVGSAWGETRTITLNASDFTGSGSSYLASEQTLTIGGIGYKANNYNPSTHQIRGNQSTLTSNFYVYNTTALPGAVKSITITTTGDNIKANGVVNAYTNSSSITSNPGTTTATAKAGSSATNTITIDLSSNTNKFFRVQLTNGFTTGTCILNSISIEYENTATVSYTVTFDAGSNGTCSTSSLTETSAGAGVTVPSITPNSGYRFKGWSTSKDTYKEATLKAGVFNPSSNCTLYAFYDKEYTVKFYVNDAQQGETQNLIEGATIAFPTDPSIDGVSFMGWTTSTIDGTQDDAPSDLCKEANMGNSDVTYYAVFADVEVGEDTPATFYYEPFTGSAHSTGFASDNVAATQSMFYDKSATVWSHYTDTKAPSTTSYATNLDGSNMSNGVKIYKQINNSTATILEVKGIDIRNAKNLNVSLYNRRSYTNATLSVEYKIDNAANYTATGGTIVYNSTNDNWKFTDGLSISGTGSTLDLKISVKVTGTTNRNMVIDDVKVYGDLSGITYSNYCTTVAAIPATVDVTIGATGYATFVAPYNMDFEGTSVTAFLVEPDVENSVVRMTSVDKVPAGTALVVKGTSASVPTTESADRVTTALEASATATAYDNVNTYYYLGVDNGTVGFRPLAEGGSIAAGKCFFKVPVTPGASPRWFAIADEETAIKSISAIENGAIYNLAGQRVGNDYKGIVIKNGKKVLVK